MSKIKSSSSLLKALAFVVMANLILFPGSAAAQFLPPCQCGPVEHPHDKHSHKILPLAASVSAIGKRTSGEIAGPRGDRTGLILFFILSVGCAGIFITALLWRKVRSTLHSVVRTAANDNGKKKVHDRAA
jgi:hypothetical protein